MLFFLKKIQPLNLFLADNLEKEQFVKFSKPTIDKKTIGNIMPVELSKLDSKACYEK